MSRPALAVGTRLVSAVAAHDPEALAWCYAPEATVWPTGWPTPAPAAEWLAAAPVIFARFPDLALVVLGSVTDDDRCALELRMTGTDATTGEPLLGEGVVVIEAREDRVVRERHYWVYEDAVEPVTA